MRIFTMSRNISDGKSKVISVFVVKSSENNRKENCDFTSLSGRLMRVSSWIAEDYSPSEGNFVANVCLKWNRCTHWYLSEEMYDCSGNKKNFHYHLCDNGFVHFVDELPFIVSNIMRDHFITHEYSLDDSSKSDPLKISERYKIEELESEPKWFKDIFGYDFNEEDL